MNHVIKINRSFQIRVYVNQYLAWFLRMKRPGHDLSWNAIHHGRYQTTGTSALPKYSSRPLEDSSKSLLANIINTDDITAIRMNHSLLTSFNLPSASSDALVNADVSATRSELRSILSELRFLTDYVRKSDEDDDISQDWKFSAMVIDRLCLVLFTILTTIFSYLTLFSAPNFFKLR